jgi:glycine cleavage system H lipoate-binding protein
MVALFVLATIILFLVVDLIIVLARRHREITATAPARDAVSNLVPHRVPAGVFLHPSHLWLTIDPRGRVRIGLDELAQKLVGRLEVVRFKQTGQRVNRGDTLFSVQLGDMELPIASPVSGIVEATQVPPGNLTGTDPELWLCSVQPDDLSAEIRPLRIAGEAASWLQSEFARLRETIHGLRLAAVPTLPDGGEPTDGLLRVLQGKDRDVVLQEFLIHEV